MSKKKTTKRKNKSFFKKNKGFFVGLSIGLVLLSGTIIGTKLILDLVLVNDDNIIDIPDEGHDDIYIPPSISSVKVEDLTDYTVTIKVFVLSSDQVTELVADFKVNGVFLFQHDLGTPDAGWYINYFTKTSFGNYQDGDIITADLHLTYLSSKDGFTYKINQNDALSFSFLYESDPDPPPSYFPPEIISNTFEYSFSDNMLTFSFATENYEHIIGIDYHFVVDGIIVIDAEGKKIEYTMSMDANGVFESTFDYSTFDVEQTNYICLEMLFTDQNGYSDLMIYEEFAQFGGSDKRLNVGFDLVFPLLVFATISMLFIAKRKKEVGIYGTNK